MDPLLRERAREATEAARQLVAATHELIATTEELRVQRHALVEALEKRRRERSTGAPHP
jgi:hypothetical protein